MKRIVAGIFAVAAITSAAAGAQAQSFNCRKVYFADEKLICESPELSMLDERLDRIFRGNMRLLSPAGRDALDREEERWVVARRRCGWNHSCIEHFYRRRIAELAERLGDNRREPPSAIRERWREAPTPEPPIPEPRRAQPRRESATAAGSEERDRVQRAERTEALPLPARRQPRREDTSAPPRSPSFGASEPRQPVPPRAGAEPSGSSERSRRRVVAPPPKAAAGSSTGSPLIEFVDPVPESSTPER